MRSAWFPAQEGKRAKEKGEDQVSPEQQKRGKRGGNARIWAFPQGGKVLFLLPPGKEKKDLFERRFFLDLTHLGEEVGVLHKGT